MPQLVGKAWSVFPTQQRNSTRAVTQVIVRPTDPATLRRAIAQIKQTELVEPAFPPDPEIAFYVPADGPQIRPGDDLAWGTHQVRVAPASGPSFTLDKIGFDFWPDAPLC